MLYVLKQRIHGWREYTMSTTPLPSTPRARLARPADLRISLPDIARLAQVQRPVVSMWRNRSARSDHPFPPPVHSEQGQEWFAVTDIVDWLEVTGRGNNRCVRDDAPAFATLTGRSAKGNETVWLGLTALLCLSAVTGRGLGGQSAEELLDLADQIDGDDTFLYSELSALGEGLESLARYADGLGDAAYSPSAAFEKLMGERFRLFVLDHAAVALTPPARRLVALLALACAGPDFASGAMVDPTGGGSDLLVELAGLVQSPEALTVQIVDDGSPPARLASRRMWVHDIHHLRLVSDEEGGYRLPAQTVFVAQYPHPGQPDLSDLSILETLDALAVQMAADHLGIVIGPASALCDVPEGNATAALSVRNDVLKTGRVRAVVRLPTGLLTTRPRRRLALWVFGPSPGAGDQRQGSTAAADLANVDLDAATTDLLVTDLVAAVGGGAHHPHFLRWVDDVSLRSGRTLFPPLTPTILSLDSAADQVLRTRTAFDRLTPTAEPCVPPSVSVREREITSLMPTALGVAASNSDIRILPGHRIDPGDFTTGDGTPVLGVPELTGGAAAGARRIGRLVFAGYSAGKYTEPGDVVFCQSPYPAAVVDARGGSVVVYPARIARARNACFVPAVLAADINHQLAGATVWKSWTVRRVPADQTGPLAAALADISREQESLIIRLSQLAQAAEELTAAVVSGEAVVTLNPKDR